MSIAGALFGFILSIFNYEPNVAPTGSIAICVLILISALPAVCHFVSYFFLRRYNLTDDKMFEVQEKLKVCREAACSMEV